MNESLFPVEDYVIQRGRMMLLEAIDEVDAARAVARSVTTPDWPLFENDAINPIVIVELVAQTAGVSLRWEEIQKHKGRKEKGGGLIVGVKKAVFFVPAIPIDAAIVTCSKKTYGHMEYAEYFGFSKMGDVRLGEVTLQVLRTN
ncbi:MAG: hypothetical protein R6T92_02330 [Desulfosalsimonadaceae bacterium]